MKNWKKELNDTLKKTYFHPHCDFCNNELIVSDDEIEYNDSGAGIFKCPVCGHIIETTHNELNSMQCSYFG